MIFHKLPNLQKNFLPQNVRHVIVGRFFGINKLRIKQGLFMKLDLKDFLLYLRSV